MEKAWYKEWFASEDYLEVYRHRNSDDTDALIDLIISNTNLDINAKILDAACGAGRHSIKFAEKGYNVTGFDLSTTLLNIAISHSNKKNLNINFINSDIRTFYTNVKFSIVLSLFTSFGYFDSDLENFKFVENAFNMLNDDGYYVLDYFNQTFLENNLIEDTKRTVGTKEIIENRKIIDGRVVKKIKIISENNNHDYIESVKLYSYDELVNNFTSIGYKKIKVFGDYLGNNFEKENSERCIIIFQK